ncbi:MAG: DUF3943 domain-containing protein [Myxococcales bacterium]|nr:DUF3943 domain-containing protein [Myxococcales bacterium]
MSGAEGASGAEASEVGSGESESEPQAEAASGALGRRGPRFPGLRTFGELTLILGAGTLWYWLDRDRNAVDWDFDSWRQRFSREAYRFDNNPIGMNFLGHAISGSSYYGISRSNGLHTGYAYLAAFLTSWAWEFLFEFKERVSINDQIITPTAGMAIGEGFHKLGRYLSGGRGRGRRALSWIFGGAHAIHDTLDGVDRRSGPADAFGFSTLEHCEGAHCGWHRRFDLALGIASAHTEGAPGRYAFGELRGGLELGEIAGHLAPIDVRGALRDAPLARLSFRAARGGEGGTFELDAENFLSGYRHQRLAPDALGQVRGHAFLIGTSVAYLYRQEELGRWTDRFGALALPGLAFELHLVAKGGAAGRGVGLQLRGRFNGDFAGIHSGPWQTWEADNPDARAKTILMREGYWYGWGGSVRLELELTLPYVTLGGRLLHGRYRSQQGLDRSQEQVRDDVVGTERVLDTDLFLRAGPFGPGPEGTGVYVELALERRGREGSLGDVEEARGMSRAVVRLGLRR